MVDLCAQTLDRMTQSDSTRSPAEGVRSPREALVRSDMSQSEERAFSRGTEAAGPMGVIMTSL